MRSMRTAMYDAASWTGVSRGSYMLGPKIASHNNAFLSLHIGKERINAREPISPSARAATDPRVSEITALRIGDLHLDGGGVVHLRGKGRKQRSVPLWRHTVRLLRQWLNEVENSPEKPLVPNARGNAMTRAGVAQRLRRAVEVAVQRNPTLHHGRISPHTIRHTTAEKRHHPVNGYDGGKVMIASLGGSLRARVPRLL